MTEISSEVARLPLVGGTLCLDFTNTAGNHAGDHPSEHLHDYGELIAWSRHAGALDPRAAQHLLRLAKRRSGEANQVFARAIELREMLYRIFSALSAGSPPQRTDMELLNHALADAFARPRLMSSDRGFDLKWEDGEDALDQMLAPIARSAVELLTSGDLRRVRECEGDTCGWLFVDKSKNHSRRWCAMNDCGNRAKARRHYKRSRRT